MESWADDCQDRSCSISCEGVLFQGRKILKGTKDQMGPHHSAWLATIPCQSVLSVNLKSADMWAKKVTNTHFLQQELQVEGSMLWSSCERIYRSFSEGTAQGCRSASSVPKLPQQVQERKRWRIRERVCVMLWGEGRPCWTLDSQLRYSLHTQPDADCFSSSIEQLVNIVCCVLQTADQNKPAGRFHLLRSASWQYEMCNESKRGTRIVSCVGPACNCQASSHNVDWYPVIFSFNKLNSSSSSSNVLLQYLESMTSMIAIGDVIRSSNRDIFFRIAVSLLHDDFAVSHWFSALNLKITFLL